MIAKHLKFVMPLFSILVIAIFVLGNRDLNFIAIGAILFMLAGFNYALFKYLNINSEEREEQKIKFSNKFESEVKIAKPLRFVGLVSIFVLLVDRFGLFTVVYSEYLYLLVIFLFLPYFFMWMYYLKKNN